MEGGQGKQPQWIRVHLDALSEVEDEAMPGQQVAVSINGVAPTDPNVVSNRYPYWSYEHMFTNGQPSAKVAGFIDFVKNDRPLLQRLKFIPVDKVKP